MVLKPLKLHQIAPICRWCGTKFFLHTRLKFTAFYENCAKSHNVATLFHNTNAVSKPEQSDLIVHGEFCQHLQNPANYK